MLAVTLTLLMKESARIAGKVGAGQVSSVVLEFGDRLLLVQAKKDNQFLVLISSQAISLTRLYRELGDNSGEGGAGGMKEQIPEGTVIGEIEASLAWLLSHVPNFQGALVIRISTGKGFILFEYGRPVGFSFRIGDRVLEGAAAIDAPATFRALMRMARQPLAVAAGSAARSGVIPPRSISP